MASVAVGFTSSLAVRSWFPLGASVVISSASLAVRVGRGPFLLVVTIPSCQGIVVHCIILAHDLHEPPGWYTLRSVLLAYAVIMDLNNFASQMFDIILVRGR